MWSVCLTISSQVWDITIKTHVTLLSRDGFIKLNLTVPTTELVFFDDPYYLICDLYSGSTGRKKIQMRAVSVVRGSVPVQAYSNSITARLGTDWVRVGKTAFREIYWREIVTMSERNLEGRKLWISTNLVKFTSGILASLRLWREWSAVTDSHVFHFHWEQGTRCYNSVFFFFLFKFWISSIYTFMIDSTLQFWAGGIRR